MTKDEIYQEIMNGRRFRCKSKDLGIWGGWVDKTYLNILTVSTFYTSQIQLEPLPEKSYTESQIVEACFLAGFSLEKEINSFLKALNRLSND